MKLSTQPYKGTRDFYPEDKRLQDYIFSTWRKAVESYGYQEYDAPVLESIELFKAKTSEEIVNEQSYSFTDRGGRKVIMRPEMTPSVSRMVAGRRQELAYPLRWYSIPNLWRYERPQKGRLREHRQLNVDVFGEEGIAAEHEMILLASDIMRIFGAKQNMYEIRINSRELVDYALTEYLGINKQLAKNLVKTVDKMHKLEPVKFKEALTSQIKEGGSGGETADKLLGLLECRDLAALPDGLKTHKSVDSLIKLKNLLSKSHVKNAVFDMSLMRGFDYYTGIVFEVFDNNPENNRSMFGGGRYDGLVGMFGVEPVPTVGFGMGDVTLINFLQSHDLLPDLKSNTDAAVILIGDVYEASLPIIEAMRREGVNVSVDASERKLDKKLKSADKQKTRYVIFIGESDLADEQYPMKDLHSGKESKHSVERIISELKRE